MTALATTLLAATALTATAIAAIRTTTEAGPLLYRVLRLGRAIERQAQRRRSRHPVG